MTKRLLLSLLAMVAFAMPAHAQSQQRQVLTGPRTVSTNGGPFVFVTQHPNQTRGYLFLKTSNKVGPASLDIDIANQSKLGAAIICSVKNIATEKVTTIAIGFTGKVKAMEIDEVCEFPLTRFVIVTLTVSGPDASFEIIADMEWVKE